MLDELGGIFERRFVAVRRVARYLLVVSIVAWFVAFTVDALRRSPGSATSNAIFWAVPVLVVLSLVQLTILRTRREVTISADLERVFYLVVDPATSMRLASSWLGRVRSIDVDPGGRKGQTNMLVFGFLPATTQWEMLEYEPPGKVVVFSRSTGMSPPVISLSSYSLSGTDGSVHLQIEAAARYLSFPLVRALLKRMIADPWWDLVLARLKVEAEQPT